MLKLFRNERYNDADAYFLTSTMLEMKHRNKKERNAISFSYALRLVSVLSVGIFAIFVALNNLHALKNAFEVIHATISINIPIVITIASVFGLFVGYKLELVTIDSLTDLLNAFKKYNSRTNASSDGKIEAYTTGFLGSILFLYMNAWIFVQAGEFVTKLIVVDTPTTKKELMYSGMILSEQQFIQQDTIKLGQVGKLNRIDIAEAKAKSNKAGIKQIDAQFLPVIEATVEKIKVQTAKLDSWKKAEMNKASNKKDGFRYLNKVYKAKLAKINDSSDLDELNRKYVEAIKLITVNLQPSEIIANKKATIYASIKSHESKIAELEVKLGVIQDEIKAKVNGAFSSLGYWIIAIGYILLQLYLEIRVHSFLVERQELIGNDDFERNKAENALIGSGEEVASSTLCDIDNALELLVETPKTTEEIIEEQKVVTSSKVDQAIDYILDIETDVDLIKFVETHKFKDILNHIDKHGATSIKNLLKIKDDINQGLTADDIRITWSKLNKVYSISSPVGLSPHLAISKVA